MRTLLFLILLTAALSAMPTKSPTHHVATVIETMNAGGYTYMHVDEHGKRYWVAVTQMPVEKGDSVAFEAQMWMPNFESRTLHRKFDRIMFAVAAPTKMQMHNPRLQNITPKTAPKKRMRKADGGYSVEEVFTHRATLKGQTVKVRGIVTKISRGIMKRDWVHLEDGSGRPGTDDLVFTSAHASGIHTGDTVIAEGTVETDKDFGYGYFYPVIIERSRFERQ